MNREELVEAIIKEVKRVLELRGVTVSSSREPISPNKGVVPSVSIPEKHESTVGTCDLAEKKVITRKDLEAYLGRSISVAKKAVITPLAFDYAREKGIAIIRTEQPAVNCDKARSALPVAVAVHLHVRDHGEKVKKYLVSKGFQIQEISAHSYETAVKNLANTVASGSVAYGVCVEKTGMEGTIHANRCDSIRAVHCSDSSEARTARLDLGANVIVLDAVSDPETVLKSYTG